MKKAEIKKLKRTDLPPLGMWRLQIDGDVSIKGWAAHGIRQGCLSWESIEEGEKLKVFEKKLQKQAQEAAAYYNLLNRMREVTNALRKTAEGEEARSIEGMEGMIHSIADQYDHYLTKHEERNYG